MSARKPPRPVTRERLRKSAIYYLQRHSPSRGQLRRVLLRRVDRALREHEGDREEMTGWVDETLDWCEQLGYLDDARYAEHKMRSLRRRGASSRKVRAKLVEKGVAGTLIDDALSTETDDAELEAALRLVRRRRFGAWRREEREPSREERSRQLAALARAGFNYDLAQRALASSLEEAEALLTK